MTNGIKRFFDYARERHSIYLRRQAGAPLSGREKMPWTEDPILGTYSFTNVFRELDKTTVWFRENVREPMRSSPDVLLATVVFRWFNRIATGEAIFTNQGLSISGGSIWDKLGKYNNEEWLHAMRNAVAEYCGSGPYVTGAYIIKTPDGYSKLDGVLKCIEWFMEQSHSIPGDIWFLGSKDPLHFQWRGLSVAILQMKEFSKPWTLETVWLWLRQFPFLGDFMAYEIVTDLRHTDLLCHAPDIMTWANPGPGATRGLGRVFEDDKNRYNQHRHKDTLIELMQALLAASQLPQNWPQWTGQTYESEDFIQFERDETVWPAWEMRDVEHTLCEFDKYERVRTGEGRPRGRFRG